ncbi:MAG: response regulator [Rhizobiales bacterium]|nr:response regulator [Hyphomicrobiales bacterium]
MVSVTADISYFDDYWRGVALPYDARVTVLRAPTAEVVAQYPGGAMAEPDGLRPRIDNLPAEGDYTGDADGRFGHFRRVGGYPMYLAVDVSTEAVVAGWREWLLTRLPLPAIAIALLAVLTALAIRDSRRQQGARRSLAVANSELTLEMRRREKAEEQLRQLQKIEAIGQLTGGIAHDFNNMLAIIVGSLNLAERRLQRGEHDVFKYITSAQEGAQRAAALTQRLLAFARRQPLSPQVIDANRFVAGMSHLLQRTLTEAIQIETVLGAGLWKTNADPAQLENALVNLAVNARDAMPEGGKLTIETANSSLDPGYAAEHAEVPAGQYVLIAVTDTGTGMSPEVAAQAFEPFFTTKGVGKGSGLGLSQVYGFVRQSGGHVKVYTELGQGTTVKIYLPRFYGEEGDARPRAVTGDEIPMGRQGEVVLLVEDEADVRRLSVDTLREIGYTVIHVDHARAALEVVNSGRRVDLMLTDIVMPEMNGRQLADRVAEIRPEIKVLFMTGFTRNAVVHNGLLDPGVRLIGKPFSIAELATSVRAALDA